MCVKHVVFFERLLLRLDAYMIDEREVIADQFHGVPINSAVFRHASKGAYDFLPIHSRTVWPVLGQRRYDVGDGHNTGEF